MGLIWLQTSDGKRIHLPVTGDLDVNTPDTAIDVSMVQAIAINRCYSEPIIVNHPTFGQFTIDLMLGRNLTGSCNQCGQCCTHPVDQCLNPSVCWWPYNATVEGHKCPHLIIERANKWPNPGNTYCDVYATILDVFKGCSYPPRNIHPWMTNCGYTVI